MPLLRRPSRRNTDAGAALILALVFLLAIGVLLIALANFAVGAQSNTINLKSGRTTEANAANAATVAIEQVRTHYNYQPQPPQLALDYSGSVAVCAPSWVNTTYSFAVYCVATS